MGYEVRRADIKQRSETEEVNAELQKSFIRHATKVMHIRDTMRGETQKTENQVEPLLLEKRNNPLIAPA